MSIIQIEHLSKTFDSKENQVHALNDVSLSIEEGEIFGVIGLSGAGKSTLVRCLNLLEVPTSGTVTIGGKNLLELSKEELRRERQSIGMIFQHFNLLMQRNVLDNVCFPMEIAGISKKTARKKALEYLRTVGLEEKAKAYPVQLSGGQKQRVSVARALAMDPEVLFFDEPTSALDPELTREVLNVIRQLSEEKMTMAVVTHEMEFAKAISDHAIFMEGGYIIEEGDRDTIFVNPEKERTRQFIHSMS